MFALEAREVRARRVRPVDVVVGVVEAELGENNARKAGEFPPQENANPAPQGNRSAGASNAVPASPKQINYLLSLASRRGITPQQIAAQNNVANVDQLTKRQCSTLIEQWKVA